MHRRLVALFACSMLASCGPSADDGVVDVAFIGDTATLFSAGLELPAGAQLMRSAQRQGLVRFNASGEVIPALAERWIVTDDGRSYIFRINEFDLPDGSRLTASAVAEDLNATLSRLDGTSLGLDLAKVSDIRAMTGRVIEIRLRSPMPGLLNLLAQPELGVALREADAGPMTARIEDGTAVLDALPPEQRGLSAQDDWEDLVSEVRIRALGAEAAASSFAQGQSDIILGGRLESLPLAITGALSRGTVRIDPAVGLFGLDVLRPEGFLASPSNREAIAMAIDRSTLLEQFNLGGWSGSTRIVAPSLPGDDGAVTQRWQNLSQEQRSARAAAIVSQWEGGSGRSAALTIALPDGPGARFLFDALLRDMAAIGVELTRAASGEAADLRLRDTVARYAGARWFLNQFNCEIAAPVCSPDTDFLVQLSLDAANPAEEASYLSEAEQTLAATNLYIPLGPPIRWSQVRAGVEGFAENSWAFHPLFPLSRAPI